MANHGIPICMVDVINEIEHPLMEILLNYRFASYRFKDTLPLFRDILSHVFRFAFTTLSSCLRYVADVLNGQELK